MCRRVSDMIVLLYTQIQICTEVPVQMDLFYPSRLRSNCKECVTTCHLLPFSVCYEDIVRLCVCMQRMFVDCVCVCVQERMLMVELRLVVLVDHRPCCILGVWFLMLLLVFFIFCIRENRNKTIIGVIHNIFMNYFVMLSNSCS